ncbi:hypothetical protein N9W89_11975 [Hellea sp.]|nr:hypothetical protein [Hellea sp.]
MSFLVSPKLHTFRKNTRLAAMFLASSALATGCASTAKGSKQSAMVGMTKAETLRTEAPQGSAMTVLRYPAVVETSAKDAYYTAFEMSAIGSGSAINGDVSERQSVADSVIVKSNYFALSLYKELAARLPEHTVLLSPHAIKLDENGDLTSEPITQAESLPSVISVDFATYSFPDIDKMMGDQPLTFGDLVTPLVSVRTDHLAQVPTHGLLFASAPLIPYAAGKSQQYAADGLDVMQRGQFDRSVPELDFISFLTKSERTSVPSKSLRGGATENVVTSYPVEKIKLDGVALAQLETANDGTIDPLERVFSDAMADNIINIINSTDTQKAVMANKAAAIADYDPSLAALTYVGDDSPDYKARLRYAERLLDAERKYLSVQSLRVFDGVHNGEMGAQMRDMIMAEYEVLDERRRLARKQNQATAFAILGAVAAGASIGSGGGGNSCQDSRTQTEYNDCIRRAQRTQYGNQVLTNLAIQGALVAAQEAIALNQRSKAIGTNYLSSIVPALEQQTSVTVDLLDSSETITAIRYEDLKSKLQNLYSNQQRSLDVVATRCAFGLENTATLSGTWMGVCEGGHANGVGSGVFKKADGSAVEYYGYASQGLPNGSGFMIFHDTSGSHAIEGNFVNGLAEGPVQVSKAGQADRLRTYRSGQDVGASSSLPSSPFNPILAR